MFIRFLLFFSLVSYTAATHAQADSIPRWEGSVSSGLFLNTFYLDFSIIGDQSDKLSRPPEYLDKKQSRVQPGKIDRIELKYNLNRKSTLSLNFAYAKWKCLYGEGSDPLGLWKETRRNYHRIQSAGNYYRNFYTKDNRGVFNTGIGFMIQGEQKSYPYYRVNEDDSTHITEITARGEWYWWDWGIQLTGSYYYQINANLKIGGTLYTYLIGTYIDGVGFMGSIAIPFGHRIKK